MTENTSYGFAKRFWETAWRLISSAVKQKDGFLARILRIWRRYGKILQYIFVAIILFMLAKELYANWKEVAQYEWRFNYFPLIISYSLLLIFFALLALNWSLTLRIFNQSLSWQRSTKIWFLSQIAKYLPGGIWNWVGRVYLCEKEGVPGIETAASIVMETLLSLLAGAMVVFGISLSGVDIGLKNQKLYVLTGILLGLIVLRPSVLDKAMNFVLRVGREEKRQFALKADYIDVLNLLALYMLAVVTGGVSFFFFTTSIYPLPLCALAGVISIHVSSYIIGFLTPFAPNGLGIREGLLAFLLSYYFPTSVAIAISLLARIWFTIGELLSIAIASRL